MAVHFQLCRTLLALRRCCRWRVFDELEGIIDRQHGTSLRFDCIGGADAAARAGEASEVVGWKLQWFWGVDSAVDPLHNLFAPRHTLALLTELVFQLALHRISL